MGALALALLALFVLAFGSGSAATQERIVVYGAEDGSHLRLHLRGPAIVVEGWMSRERPVGCRFQRYRTTAVCPLRDATAIELDMGPSGDMVKVLEKLPIPLTVYLGHGSDKFIGSGERDTCYSQGSKRNRCIGRGGNDICITGQRNSDCVGGRGDDFCQHGAGSDGCWGGPGRDVCRMGPGHDGCHGGAGNDLLFGGSSSDRLYGGGGHDRCDGGSGWGRSQACEGGPRR